MTIAEKRTRCYHCAKGNGGGVSKTVGKGPRMRNDTPRIVPFYSCYICCLITRRCLCFDFKISLNFSGSRGASRRIFISDSQWRFIAGLICITAFPCSSPGGLSRTHHFLNPFNRSLYYCFSRIKQWIDQTIIIILNHASEIAVHR